MSCSYSVSHTHDHTHTRTKNTHTHFLSLSLFLNSGNLILSQYLILGCKGRWSKKKEEKKQFLPNLLCLMVHLAQPTAEICAQFREVQGEREREREWERGREREREWERERMRKQFFIPHFSYEWFSFWPSSEVSLGFNWFRLTIQYWGRPRETEK